MEMKKFIPTYFIPTYFLVIVSDDMYQYFNIFNQKTLETVKTYNCSYCHDNEDLQKTINNVCSGYNIIKIINI